MSNGVFEVSPTVKLVAKIQGGELGPKELVVFGAKGTLKKGDPHSLYEEAKKEGNIEKIMDRILDATIGSGHIDVLDQATYTFVFSDIPRLTTLFIVSPPYLSHLQQSMRYVEPYGIYLPEELKEIREIRKALENGLRLYYKFVEEGVPKEDARFITPLYTVTNIQTTGNVRAFTHLLLMSQEDGVPPINKEIIKQAVSLIDKELIKNREANYKRMRYFPAPNLFSENNHLQDLINEHGNNIAVLLSHSEPTYINEEKLKYAIKYGDENYLGILKHFTYTFLVKMSIVTYHQAVRQRTWIHHVESIYHALERFEIVIPPSIIRRGLQKKYKEYIEELYKLYIEYRESIPKNILIGIVSQAHTIYDLIRIDGWNYVGAVPLRRCLRAQWEIRNLMSQISRHISKINPVLGKYSLPTCRTLGICYEKRPCDQVDKLLSTKPIIDI